MDVQPSPMGDRYIHSLHGKLDQGLWRPLMKTVRDAGDKIEAEQGSNNMQSRKLRSTSEAVAALSDAILPSLLSLAP